MGQPAFAKARPWRDGGRAILFPWMHQPVAVRSSRTPRSPRARGPLRRPIFLQYIPAPNNPNGTFSTSAYNETLRDDKGAYRLDGTTRWGMLSAYYFLDGWSQNNPYPVAQGGANVPGFNALNLGRAQLLSLGDTKTISSTAVNEFHFSFMRDATDLGQPIGGVGASLASQGFVVGENTPGIVALSPKTEGVESVNFNNFSIGTNTNELKQVNNTFQWRDGFSKVVGTHTIKVGGGVPLRSSEYESDCPVERQFHILRQRDRHRFRGLPVRHSEPVQPKPASAFLRAQ